MSEPEAWLFYCWAPGKSAVFASVDKEDKAWWPTDDWHVVTRMALHTKGIPVVLHGDPGKLPRPIRFTGSGEVK